LKVKLEQCHGPVAYGGRGFNPLLPRNSKVFDKAKLNSQFCGKYLSINLIRILVSLICKLNGTLD
jgi:hypothetical protein